MRCRARNNALAGREIGGDRPQPQRHIERIKAERRPEGQLTYPMLSRMAVGAQRNGVAIARLHADTAIGSSAHMRRLRRRCFAARHAGQLPDKSQMLTAPTKVELALTASHRARDARGGHQREAPDGFGPVHRRRWFRPSENWFASHGVISRLARNAAFNANCPWGSGMSLVARIFSMTRSINNLKLCNFTVEGLNEGRIGLHPHDGFGEHVMPAQDIDPAALRHIELALQLRPEPLIDLTEEPVIDLRVRQ